MEAEESTVCKSEGLSIIGVIPIIIKWKEALKSNAKTRKERMEEIQNGVHQNQFAKVSINTRSNDTLEGVGDSLSFFLSKGSGGGDSLCNALCYWGRGVYGKVIVVL